MLSLVRLTGWACWRGRSRTTGARVAELDDAEDAGAMGKVMGRKVDAATRARGVVVTEGTAGELLALGMA